MKISIIMPVYNAEKYLDESISSVLLQAYSSWELIIVDDGSTDSSGIICDSFSEKHPSQIKVIHKENEGQFLSRKCGVENASGDYIGFLDADDILDKDYMKDLSEALAANNYPDVICFGFSRFNENGITKQYNLPADSCLYDTEEKRKELYLQIIDGKLTGSLCSKLLSRKLLLKNFNKSDSVCNSRFGEDAYQSFTALGNAQSILFVNKSYYFYRENPAGASEGFERKDFDYFNTRYVFELLLNFLPQWGLDDTETKKKVYARNFNETVYYILRYLRESKSIKRKADVVKYNWNTYLLDNFNELIIDNPYVRHSYLPVWQDLSNHKTTKIMCKEFTRKIRG